ncbi:MAG: DNA polymerase III subunit chi [Hylemonella sp.]|nr:DNA polymerase III subunit chi [Hylemonella sp.]
MTEVAFHFNAPDKLAYACRLLRKAVTTGSRVVVTAPADALARLDALLWTFSQTDFIAHVRQPAEPGLLAASPVVLTEAPAQALPHRQVLLNLGTQLPAGFDHYERVIEVVSLDDEDRQLARGRWKQYTELGYEIVRHDLNLKGAN